MKQQTALTEDLVRKIAHLARMKLTEDEREKRQGELSSILAYVEVIGKLEASGTSAQMKSSHINVFRDDVPEESFKQSEATASGASVQDGHFVIPAVISN